MTVAKFRRDASIAEYIIQRREFAKRFPHLKTHDDQARETPQWKAFLFGWEEEKREHLQRSLACKSVVQHVFVAEPAGKNPRPGRISDLIIEEIGRGSGTATEIALRLNARYSGLNVHNVRTRVSKVAKSGRIVKIDTAYHLVH